jgi:DNA-directed RNA polymerase subunit RPC12/RpoP
MSGCDKARARHLMTTYGITCEQYDALLEAQGGRCGICGAKPRKIRLAVEHDHKTGEIHGLACARCNHRLLGQHGRDPEKYERLVEFLRNPPARAILGDHRVPPIVKRRAA